LSKIIDFGKIQTGNKLVIEMLNQAQNMAHQRYPVLIIGESGTGRRLVAEFIHEKSLPHLDIIRFNHLQMPSLKEVKSGATVLVENVDQFDFVRQEKLMQIINHTHSSERPIFWIATATEQIHEKTKTGRLRRDLYNFFKLQILKTVPLRQRQEDMTFISNLYLKSLSFLSAPKFLSENAKDELAQYNWPGNFAELEEKLTHACALSQDGRIESLVGFQENKIKESLKGIQSLAEMEKQLIFQTLTITKHNKSQAARLLGISIRTLRNKLSLYESHNMQANEGEFNEFSSR
jgi:DNA-binding NtrC family response regulator